MRLCEKVDKLMNSRYYSNTKSTTVKQRLTQLICYYEISNLLFLVRMAVAFFMSKSLDNTNDRDDNTDHGHSNACYL